MQESDFLIQKCISVRARGPIACFTIPQLRAETMTYDIPTPSALSGLMHRAYSEKNVNWIPIGFCLLAPVQKTFVSVVEHGAVKNGFGRAEKANQIRQRECLLDVDYAIWYRAIERLHPVTGQSLGGDISRAVARTSRRLQQGRFDCVPHFGMAEFAASISVGPERVPATAVKEFRAYRMMHSFSRYERGDGVDPLYYMPEVYQDGFVACDPRRLPLGAEGITWFGRCG